MHSDPPLRLVESGDSTERLWGQKILRDLPEYETLWQRHVVPLTFRLAQDPSKRCRFVRPGLPAHLLALADSHYSVFHHVAHCYRWIRRVKALESLGPERVRRFPSPTEALYAFLAHAISANDAVLHFAAAANAILERYGRAAVFTFQPCTDGYARYLCSQPPLLDLDEYNTLIYRLKQYRNQLVHQHPVYIHNTLMPVPRCFPDYASLAGIGRVAANPQALRDDFQPMAAFLQEPVRLLARKVRPVWRLALQQLDALEGTMYDVDRSFYPDIDLRLSIEDFEAIRSL